MSRTRLLAAAALTAACIAVPAAPASANHPCHEDPCPPCHTAWIDQLWQKYTGLGPLFMCP